MSYPITDIEGIDGDIVIVLKSAGIRSTDRLLEAARTVKGRKLLSEKTGFDEKRLLCWANVADRMRIKGISKEYAAHRAKRPAWEASASSIKPPERRPFSRTPFPRCYRLAAHWLWASSM